MTMYAFTSRPTVPPERGACVRPGAGGHGARRMRYLLAVLLLLSMLLPVASVQAQAWLLTPAERKSYLEHYAPVILQRAEESGSKLGRDWLANYDFDRDGYYANNRYNWANLLSSYVAGAASGSTMYQHWRIRPTLYSSSIEFMEGGSKTLILLYHVYHPVDKKASQIHDWERIEIAVRGVTGVPGGAGEYVSYSTITSHKDHVMRRIGSPDLNFMQVAGGKHLMIWQADEDGNELGTHGHELHFVQDSYSLIVSRVAAGTSARVEITDDDDKSVHYVWVPESSANAVAAWGARGINYSNAASLASGRDTTVNWPLVKRITYELQDLADVYKTHWSGVNWSLNWVSSKTVDIQLESAILDEAGLVQVPAGWQRFYVGSRDAWSSDETDGREGVMIKKWFWGNYSAENSADTFSGTDDFGGYEGLGRGSDNYNRADASGDYASLNNYWRQHDYFAHSGLIDTREHYESGSWLRAGWHLGQNGGHDGRWVQIFDDRVAYEPLSPLSVSLPSTIYGCGYPVYVTVTVSGGTTPYSYAWSNVVWSSADGRSAEIASGATATLAVTDAAGQRVTSSVANIPRCPGGGGVRALS